VLKVCFEANLPLGITSHFAFRLDADLLLPTFTPKAWDEPCTCAALLSLNRWQVFGEDALLNISVEREASGAVHL
jgi:hypothetical protein